MQEKIEPAMSTRDEVEADLSENLVVMVRQQIGACGDAVQFRNRLVHILTRYEVYLAGTKVVPRNEQRKQLTKLHDKSVAFLTALDGLHPEVRGVIQSALSQYFFKEQLNKFSIWDDRLSLDAEDSSIEDTEISVKKIIKACCAELDFLEKTKGAKKKSKSPALDQLLIDLAALYEAETGRSAKAQCYRDEVSEGGYSGKFFFMAKSVLDDYDPKGYSTPGALGIRIQRVLLDD